MKGYTCDNCARFHEGELSSMTVEAPLDALCPFRRQAHGHLVFALTQKEQKLNSGERVPLFDICPQCTATMVVKQLLRLYPGMALFDLPVQSAPIESVSLPADG